MLRSASRVFNARPAQRRRREGQRGDGSMHVARSLAIAAGLKAPYFRIGHVDVSRDALGAIHEVMNADVLFVPDGTRPPAAADRLLFRGEMRLSSAPGGVFYVRSQDVVRPHLRCWELSSGELGALNGEEILEPGMPPCPRSAIRSARPRSGMRVWARDAGHLLAWLDEAFPAGGSPRLPVAAPSAAALSALRSRIRSALAGGAHVRTSGPEFEISREEATALDEADVAAHGFGAYRALDPARAVSGHTRACWACARLGIALRSAVDGTTLYREDMPTEPRPKRARRRRRSKRRRADRRDGATRTQSAAAVSAT